MLSKTNGEEACDKVSEDIKEQKKLPKNPVDFFLHSRKTKALVLVKEPDKNREKFSFIFKMAHFTSQNGPFCSAK